MRRAWIFAVTASLFATGLGCSRTCQHTAGVCDCCPPPVESVLMPYANVMNTQPPAPLAAPGAPPPQQPLVPHPQ